MAETGRALPLRSVSFDEFVAGERPRLLAMAFALCADRYAAEDLVQEALIEAYRRWDRIAEYEEPGAWARRVVMNRSTSRWRRMRSESNALERLNARPAAIPFERDPDADRFWAAVRALPRRQSQMVALRYVEDLSIAEIATVMACAEGTVKATLSQARAALAKALRAEVRNNE